MKIYCLFYSRVIMFCLQSIMRYLLDTTAELVFIYELSRWFSWYDLFIYYYYVLAKYPAVFSTSDGVIRVTWGCMDPWVIWTLTNKAL